MSRARKLPVAKVKERKGPLPLGLLQRQCRSVRKDREVKKVASSCGLSNSLEVSGSSGRGKRPRRTPDLPSWALGLAVVGLGTCRRGSWDLPSWALGLAVVGLRTSFGRSWKVHGSVPVPRSVRSQNHPRRSCLSGRHVSWLARIGNACAPNRIAESPSPIHGTRLGKDGHPRDRLRDAASRPERLRMTRPHHAQRRSR